MQLLLPPDFSTGIPIQMVSSAFSAVATGTTVIPYDDTIPQNTEGDQYMTLAITPKSATNILVIEADAYFSHTASATTNIIAALFQDSAANALAADAPYASVGTGVLKLRVAHTMTAGTTSATTFKVRLGCGSAGTGTFNGQLSGRFFGTTSKSFFKITEYVG